MPASATGPDPIIRWAVVIALVCGCKDEPRKVPAVAQVAADAAVAVDAAVAPDAAENPNKITISIAEPPSPEKAFAKRCTLAGDPLKTECMHAASIAVDRSGTLYVATGTKVQRYRRSGDEACRFDPTGAAIALPADVDRMQDIDGPIVMRSGGVEWGLRASRDAVYAYDFVGGLCRVDRGKAEPVCTDEEAHD